MSARSLIKGAKLWPWAIISRIGFGLLGLAIVVSVMYRLFVLPDVLRKEIGEARQDEKAATATVNTMQSGQEIMTTRELRIEHTREIVRENADEILSAPGAGEVVPPAVHDAFLNSIGRLRDQANDRQRAID